MGVRLGSRLHQGAWMTRAVPRLVALVPIEAATIRRVKAPIQMCGHFTSSLYVR